ncbi:MAG: SRPBCC family protein [Saprospiraceae bacterium]|nr:SRPBCC family protein [Saprospiraceae bacterium]
MNYQLIALLSFFLVGFNQTIMGQAKKKPMEVQKSIYIDLPPAELWKITADDFVQVDKWISGVNLAEGTGQGVGAARTCTPSYKGFSETTERIIDFQPTSSFTYQIVEGMPKMIAFATNTWKHEPQGEGTLMSMQVKMQVKGFMGTLMKGFMKKRMKGVLQDALEELKLYAETGDLHERKMEAMRKFHAKSEVTAPLAGQ